MKTLRILFTATLFLIAALSTFAQEIDDMYFNSRDREKLNQKKISADLGLARKNDGIKQADSPINPTDSYSARNINPEYSSQLDSNGEALVENDYFLPDFQPTGVNQNLSNCNCGSGSYYNPYYGNSAFNNPYHGYSDGFGSPYSSYYPSAWGGYPSYGYNSGLSMSLGYGWSGFSPGFYGGLGYGYGSYAGNFWNSYYSPWGGYYGSYYPGQVIVINSGDVGSRVSYSKRSSRSSTINHNVNYTRPSSTQSVAGTGRSSVSGGRTRTNSPEYYDSGWRRSQSTGTTRSYWSTYGGGANSNTTGDFNRTGTSFGGRQSSSGFSTPTRSFSTGGNSGGTRSSGSSGSSSGSRTRGRNN